MWDGVSPSQVSPLGNPPPVSAAPAPTDPETGSVEIDPTALTPPLDWSVLFGNRYPVEIDLGCGKGLFLEEVARRNPQSNFLGVERAAKYFRKAAKRLRRARLGNVRMLRGDGLDALQRWVRPHSVQTIHLYFPDPWPKKRHQKRRLVAPPLLALAHRALLPGGELRLATDHVGYRAVIQSTLAAHSALFTELPWPADAEDRLPTNYALKWQRQGRLLWWARFRATPGAGVKSALA
jgi:tRNA (guanine-N7-)-methyltransferase